MTATPHTLAGSMTIAEAVAFFTTGAHHRSYPVIDPTGRPIVLVSRIDALRWQIGETSDETTRADAISDVAEPVSYPETTSGVAADLISETGIGRIPIVDRVTCRVHGIISRQELLEARSANPLAETGRRRFVRRKSSVTT